MTGIGLMPKAVTVTHMCCECVCSDCDAVTVTKPPGIKRTPMEPNLLTFLTSVWGKAVRAGNAITLLNGTFGTDMCRTAVKHAQVAALYRIVCYMTPIIRPSLPVFGWRCL